MDPREYKNKSLFLILIFNRTNQKLPLDPSILIPTHNLVELNLTAQQNKGRDQVARSNAKDMHPIGD